MEFSFKVNGKVVKTPSSFKVEFQPISDGERLLDGTMVVQGVAAKLALTVGYSSIAVEDLRLILGETWSIFKVSKKITQTVSFLDVVSGEEVTINTYFAPMSVDLSPKSLKNGKWESFEMKFIEL